MMFRKRNALILLVTFLILSLIVAGCGGNKKEEPKKEDTETSEVIKIGVFEPMTNANAAGGAMEVEGIQLANDLYPEVLGKKIKLVIADNKSDKVEAANAVTRLVEKEKVVAIIGSWGSSFSMAAGPIVKENKIPAVAASATNPLVTKGNDYYFRVCFIDPFQGKVMANYAFNQIGAKKAAIIKEVSNDYAVGLAKFFSDEFVKLTGDPKSIVANVDYQTNDQEFSAQLQAAAQANPDVIFAPGNFTESALIIKQAREQGIDIPIIGGDTWEAPEFLQIGGEAVEGAVFSTFFTSEVPITKESEKFLAEYRKKYNEEPSSVAALGYDAYLVIRAAIEKAGSTDPVKIRDEIAKTKDFVGAAGIITLDENGDAVKSAVIKKVENGKFVYQATVEPSK
ncbi:MAG: branched-chain amino acid transport system substrate-binding protein [Clostridia bacterium]|nr:branched-chain amino acid transport system substrate-binding protein [Clostridia bacterium]MDN5323871.1 branched-chain amino acid transport system substrate-binding protein [Clostridia bacterium]